MPTAWTCVENASSTDCIVTASTTLPEFYNGPNFQEFLFVTGVIVFFLALTSWRFLLKPIKTIFYGDN